METGLGLQRLDCSSLLSHERELEIALRCTWSLLTTFCLLRKRIQVAKKLTHLDENLGDEDRVREKHSVHGQREGQPPDSVLQEGPQGSVTQKVHHPKVAGQQLVDVVGWEEARHCPLPASLLLQLADFETHGSLEQPGC